MLDRLSLILNNEIINKFKTSKILIVGIGGVGGYALECLVRSGFEDITIVDKDVVDKTNLNRQIIALNSNIELKKTEVAKKRALDINPNVKINVIDEFILEDNIKLLFNKEYDYIIDACDTITTKILLLKYAYEKGINIISCMGTGNRFNSSKLSITKLNKTFNDPLAKNMRRILKEKDLKINPTVVWSEEIPVKTYNKTPGSIVLVPMQAGNLCASYVINDIIKNS